MTSWKTLGDPAPTTLGGARLTLHWAAQLASAAGTTLADPKDDFSHTNLRWDEGGRALVGEPLGERGAAAGLRVADLTLLALESGRVVDERALAGWTVDEALGWLGEALIPRVDAGAHAGRRARLERPGHDMPEHPVANGARFELGAPEASQELARWFSDAHRAIAAVAVGPEASEVRCWPHHFDIASLIALGAAKDGGEARSIGVGMTPGDGSYAEPYFYVTPWPYPTADALPALAAGGRWHTAQWTGAVLTGSALCAGPPQTQAQRAGAFLEGAVAACRRLRVG